MPDSVASFATLPAGWLSTYLLHSTAVLGAVWLLVRVGVARAPATQDLLWKVALLAGLVTATASLARPGDAPRRFALRATEALVAAGPGAPGRDLPGAPLHGQVRLQARLSPASPACVRLLASLSQAPGRPPAPGRVRAACARGPGVWWPAGAVGLWLLGALAAVGAGLRSHRAMRSGLGALHPAAARAVGALARVAAGVRGLRPPLVSATAASPCVAGGRIVLPERCERGLSDGELEAVLAHEAAHVARRDGLWLGIFEALSRALWFQPLNRVALRGFMDAAELVCDDWAVARTGRALDLARSISRVAEWSVPSGRPLPGTALTRRGPGLSRRVRRILRGRAAHGGSRWMRLAVAAAVVVPAFALPAVPVARQVAAVVIRAEGRAGVAGAAPAAVRRIRLLASEAPLP